MTATELDTAYTALANAMNAAGKTQTPLLLSMVALALMAQHADCAAVLKIIAQAEKDVLV
jgi:hypothetical protein